MNTFRSHETMFEGDDLGEAHPLELESMAPRRASAPTSSWAETTSSTPTATWLPTATSSLTSTSIYVPPTRLVWSNPLLAAMSEIPMSIWKRLAIYPFGLWLIVYLMLPCRLSGGATLVLFGLGGLGTVGAWLRYRAYDRFASRLS